MPAVRTTALVVERSSSGGIGNTAAFGRDITGTTAQRRWTNSDMDTTRHMDTVCGVYDVLPVEDRG